MTNAELMAIVFATVIPLLSWAVSWGAMRANARVMAQQIERMDHSIANFGGRVGEVEKAIVRLCTTEEVSRGYRSQKGGG